MKIILLLILVSCLLVSAHFDGARTLVPEDAGACNNTNDLGVFNQSRSTFHASLQGCAQKCLGDAACATTCVQNTLKLTQACSECFGTTIHCTEVHCVLQCSTNPNSDACLNCVMKNCEPALLQCAGVPQDVIPP